MGRKRIFVVIDTKSGMWILAALCKNDQAAHEADVRIGGMDDFCNPKKCGALCQSC